LLTNVSALGIVSFGNELEIETATALDAETKLNANAVAGRNRRR
jgi:hypothetical protein